MQRDYEIYHADVTAAFLYGLLEEVNWMKKPPGLDSGGNGDHLKLRKALPGLKQASRQWFTQVRAFFLGLNFLQSNSDPCLFVQKVDEVDWTYVCVSTDDFAMAGRKAPLDALVAEMKKKYEITVDFELDWYLNIAAKRDRVCRTLELSQQLYIENALERFGMKDAKAAPTPATAEPLRDGPAVDVQFRELVGTLLYPAVKTRPDIQNAVSRAARYCTRPTAQAWTALKRILRYLKGTKDMALRLGGVRVEDRCFLDTLEAYVDADYAGDVETRRSTAGGVVTFCGTVIAWFSKLQRSVALSTAEAELMALCDQTKEVIWLRRLLADLGWVAPWAEAHKDIRRQPRYYCDGEK